MVGEAVVITIIAMIEDDVETIIEIGTTATTTTMRLIVSQVMCYVMEKHVMEDV